MTTYKKIRSVCMISGEENRMTRLADIEGVRLVLPKITGHFKGYQRDRLYYSRQQFPNMQPGQLGVWEWQVDADDRVESTYMESITPYEIIIKYVHNEEKEFCKKLTNCLGLPLPNHNLLILLKKQINISITNRIFKAVLCKPNQFKIVSNGICIKDDVYSLPCYDIYEKDIIRTNQTFNMPLVYLYNSISLPAENDWLPVRDPLLVIKDMLLENFNKRFRTELGITRKEGSQLRSIIENITEKNIPERISELCHFSLKEANIYWEKFQTNFNNYISSDDIENKILQYLLINDESLQTRLKEEWYKMQREELEKEQKEFRKEQEAYRISRDKLELEKKNLAQKLEAARSEHQQKLTQIQQKTQAAEKHLKTLEEEAALYEQLGEESLQRVREKLSLARKDAADFLANLTLFGVYGEQKFGPSSSAVATPPQFIFKPGAPAEEQEEVEDSEDCIELLRENLKAAGATHEKELASFLYGSFLSGTSLLLAGPQGAAVADALSCTMTGRHGAILDCCGTWSPQALESVMKDDSSVVIVKHPFVHRWIDQLVSEVDGTKKMWIFVHPYAEDLPLEPAGLYSYLYPLILDAFITSRDSGSRKGGRKTSSYKQALKSVSIPADADHLFRLMGCKPALKNNGREVTAWAYPFMNERSREFFHFACLLFPLAVALDQKEKFSEKLQEAKNLSSTDRRIFEVLLGERS